MAEDLKATETKRFASGVSATLTSTCTEKEIVCGPLLNYRRMEGRCWYGSVLIVTRGGGKTQAFVPTLVLTRSTGQRSRQIATELTSASDEASRQDASGSSLFKESANITEFEATCLYSDPHNTFWAFDLIVNIADTQTRWEYEIPGMHFASKTKPRRNGFFVPSIAESFRILFYSCNGFSDGIDEDSWSGPALWSDVLRRHAKHPWHVMIGGGDQIYNDGVGLDGPLRPWTDIQDPEERRKHGFPSDLQQACDDYYRENYIRWYSTEPFASANGAIPQLSIWDDHDIIDGYGSYSDEFMRCDVFVGIGRVAFKYYMLFQHHLPPPSPYRDSSSPIPAMISNTSGAIPGDPIQPSDVFIGSCKTEPSYILGPKPGPYISEPSHSIFTRLGARIAFVGIDARTERTLRDINYPETYDKIFLRARSELESAKRSREPYKHLILLLGIPVAYPRLTLLEDICKSSVLAPLKFLNRKLGTGGTLFNHFDGSVDLLDDMEDHYTARTHKKERNALIERLQELAADYSVRVTILGGDVHLAALGRFYSNPDLKIPAEKDHRYMVNVISSAITNEPPPRLIADYLAWRNTIHHLNPQTDETMLSLFNKDPGNSRKTAGYNNVTMPSRNFAAITENSPNHQTTLPPTAIDVEVHRSNDESAPSQFAGKDGLASLHAGEVAAGTEHKAASEEHGSGSDGSLDVCFFVEVDHQDREGKTERYGLNIPALHYGSASAPSPEPSSLAVPQASSVKAVRSRKPRTARCLTKTILSRPFRRRM